MDKQSLRSKSASRINSVVQDKRRLREDVLLFVLLSARTDLSQAAFASVCNGHAVTRFYLRVFVGRLCIYSYLQPAGIKAGEPQ